MSAPSEPGSDAKAREDILSVVKLLLSSELLDVKNKIERGRVEMLDMERRLDKKIEERTTPKAIPWLSIAGFTITALIFVGAIMAAFIMYHIGPIQKDMEDMTRKLDRDTTAMERRLSADIDTIRRDVASFKEATNRDLQWNYANQNLRHDFSQKNTEKLWGKVFSAEPPVYQPPARPTQ